MKKILTIISLSLIFLSIIFFIVLIVVGLFTLFDDKDICLDTGICKKGLEINTSYGLIKINKENCIKYNWLWDEENETCNLLPVNMDIFHHGTFLMDKALKKEK